MQVKWDITYINLRISLIFFLREVMLSANVVAVAKLILHTKEHLAILVVYPNVIVMNTIRWADELRKASDLNLPMTGKTGLKGEDLKMANRLIGEKRIGILKNIKTILHPLFINLLLRKLKMERLKLLRHWKSTPIQRQRVI